MNRMHHRLPSEKKNIPLAVLTGALAALVGVAGGFFLGKDWYFLFLLPVGVVVSFFFVQRPHAAFLLMIAFIPLDSFAYLSELGAKLSLFKILTPLAVLGCIRLAYKSKTYSFRFGFVEICFILYTVYCLLLVPFAMHLGPAVIFARKIVSFLALYLLMIHLTKLSEENFQQKIALTLLGSTVLSGFFSFYSTLQGKNIFSEFEDSSLTRITGASTVSPNDYAYVLFLPLALALLSVLTPSLERWKRLACFGALGVLGASLLLTYSRSAALTFALAFFLVLVFLGRKVTGKYLLVLLICVAVGGVFMPDSFKDRMLTLASFSPDTQSGQELSLMRRANYLVVGTNILRQFPFLGAGPGSFPILHASSEYQDIPAFYGSERMPHNLYLQVATETGLVGLALFCFPVGILFVRLWRRISRAPDLYAAAPDACLLLALVSSLGMGMFLHILLHKSLWVILAFCTLACEDTSYSLISQRLPHGLNKAGAARQ